MPPVHAVLKQDVVYLCAGGPVVGGDVDHLLALVLLQEGGDAFGAQEVAGVGIGFEDVGDGAGQGHGLRPGEGVGQSHIPAPRKTEDALTVLRHTEVLGVEHAVVAVVAEVAEHAAPLVEVGLVLLVDEGGHVLLHQYLGAECLDGVGGVPED